MEENLIVEKKKIPLLPAAFFILVILATVWLAVTNYFYSKENNRLTEENSNLETAINNLKQDKKISVYELLQNYNKEFKKLEKNSDIVKYMEHLEDLWAKYQLTFKWFSINDSEIKTEIVFKKYWVRSSSETYEKVQKFISEYREDKESPLKLEFITSFEWMDEIKFPATFKIKNEVEKVKPTWENSENLSDKKQ